MNAHDIDQIVNEILEDMSHREKDVLAHSEPVAVTNVENAFEELIQEDDEKSRDVMRRIWKELQHTHRIRKI